MYNSFVLAVGQRGLEMGDVVEIDSRLLRLHPADNVAVAIEGLPQGTTIRIGNQVVDVKQEVPFGHKIAIRQISAGEKIIKYGAPIGSATSDIAPGEHVHIHNVKSDYLPTFMRGYNP